MPLTEERYTVDTLTAPTSYLAWIRLWA